MRLLLQTRVRVVSRRDGDVLTGPAGERIVGIFCQDIAVQLMIYEHLVGGIGLSIGQTTEWIGCGWSGDPELQFLIFHPAWPERMTTTVVTNQARDHVTVLVSLHSAGRASWLRDW